MRILNSSDRALARRVLDGDAGAFDDFFESHFQRLYRFALTRVGHDPEMAGEVVQATLVKALDKLHSYRGDSSLFTWMCSICRFEILDQHRASSRVDLIDDHPRVRAVLQSLTCSDSEHPESSLERDELVRLVHATLDHLPERYGSALEMRYLEGRSVEEIATRLETGYKATESLLSRARAAFKKAFHAVAEAAAPVRSASSEPGAYFATSPEGVHR